MKPTTHHRRAARWTTARRVADYFLPQLIPGRHHALWGAR